MSVTESIWYYPLACSVILSFHVGTFKIMTILFVASIERYGVSRKQASFPYVLRIVTENTVGPFVGLLGCRFDTVHIIIAGCVISALSMGACFFAESIHAVTVLWGIVYGIGTGMSRHPQGEFLSRHFTDNLARASGISSTGVSIAGVILPPIFKALLSNYDLSGAFLIFSAATLNAIPAGMLLLRKRPVRVVSEDKYTHEDVLLVKCVPENAYKVSIIHGNVSKLRDNLMESSTAHTTSKSKLEYIPVPQSGTQDLATGTELKMCVERKCKESGRDSPVNNSEFVISEKSSATEVSDASSERNNKEPLQLPPTNANKNTSVWKALNIYLDPLFQLIALTQSLYFYTLNILLIIITDYARDVGIDATKSIYVLMCFGVGDFVSRIGLGWVTDKGYMTISNFSALAFFGFGITFSAITFSDHYLTVLILSFFSGVMTGCQLIIQPGMIAEFFEGQRRMMAMTSRTFYSAPLSLTIPLVIGFFRESLGSYVWLIYFCSSLSIACGIISALLPCIYRCSCRIKLSR